MAFTIETPNWNIHAEKRSQFGTLDCSLFWSKQAACFVSCPIPIVVVSYHVPKGFHIMFIKDKTLHRDNNSIDTCVHMIDLWIIVTYILSTRATHEKVWYVAEAIVYKHISRCLTMKGHSWNWSMLFVPCVLANTLWYSETSAW